MTMPIEESFAPGDRVQQVAPAGLAMLICNPYVVRVIGEELELSESLNGPPMKDLCGQPRHWPCRKFRRVKLAG